MLIATGIATVLWVPTTFWQQWFKEIGASAIYVQNWVLASDSVDYLGADNAPSAVQHFWSLSVEEQLYIFWPLVITSILLLARRSASVSRHRLIGAALVALTVISFLYAIYGVGTDPAPAYFSTLSRAWEFGVGGLLALFASRLRVDSPRINAGVSWAGYLMLGATVFIYTPETPFPGAAALPPVLGTLLVIWAGTPPVSWAPTRLVAIRPVQWIGDISYSLYLWHWPLIVILPFALGHPLGRTSLIGVLVVSIVLAWLSKVLIEDRTRSLRFLTSRPAMVTLTATVVATGLVFSSSVYGYVRTGDSIARAAAQAREALSAVTECAGAVATIAGSDCPDPYAPNHLTNASVAATDIGKGVQAKDKCKQSLEGAAVVACTVGDVKRYTQTLALFGDSHAGHFLEALDLYGKERGIRFVTYLKTWCAGIGAEGVEAAGHATVAATESCTVWGRAALSAIASRGDIDGVIFSNFTQHYVGAPAEGSGHGLTATDFMHAWQPLINAGKKVIAIRDIPNAGNLDVPACVAEHSGVNDPCTVPFETSRLPDDADPMVLAAKEMPMIKVVDIQDVFCTGMTCHTLIGGLVAYFGSNHMTATFSRTLAPVIGSRIEVALAG
ncbi:hypothetical protein ASC59_07390 [Leifsonia sp. Root1293]|nr:hypothetical protein ASC59_07390 [Leifsonia sp. Root1293]KRA11839.1 hypothetical protein ASD61_07390 [Leifsonia sp. Root60]